MSGTESIAYFLSFQGLNALVGFSAKVSPSATPFEINRAIKSSSVVALGFRDTSGVNTSVTLNTDTALLNIFKNIKVFIDKKFKSFFNNL
ncbi:hypothetical protein TAO_0978 [Candidatus Nitrosoglobus terrae]|uniref:Uncharacterized protein n=1 Tax=Candidatus Nitrosoglobus terrae TaxID=1630141 RepID=A0A1Q2SMI0_9GAMM|nr:hypothetical protein [Candidatus Nitrosoglobus terrae]BAW80348.1 hypothetical protein TAO_0978 [Candidatus Nitrosoglobus terrae]